MWLLKGDAAQRALMAAAYGWEPAADVSGRSWMADLLAPLLEDPYSAVRFIAARTLRNLPGYEDLELDGLASPARRASMRRQVEQRAESSPTHAERAERLGPMDTRRRDALLSERDDRPVDLKE